MPDGYWNVANSIEVIQTAKATHYMTVYDGIAKAVSDTILL
jgi:hypothetical protein